MSRLAACAALFLALVLVSSVGAAQSRDNAAKPKQPSCADASSRPKFKALPAGRYVVRCRRSATLRWHMANPAEAANTEFLERASARAVRFTLGDGETRSVDLKLTSDF